MDHWFFFSLGMTPILQPVRYDYCPDQFLHCDVPLVSDLPQLRVGSVSQRLHELRQIGSLQLALPLLSAGTSILILQFGAI